MLASVINVIIILNVLISILGDSYHRFQAEAIVVSSMEMTELIIEIETMMFWRRSNNEKKYLQVCDSVRYDGITDAWEGKLKAISDIVNNSAKHSK